MTHIVECQFLTDYIPVFKQSFIEDTYAGRDKADTIADTIQREVFAAVKNWHDILKLEQSDFNISVNIEEHNLQKVSCFSSHHIPVFSVVKLGKSFQVELTENVLNIFILISLLQGLGVESNLGLGSFKITSIDGVIFKTPSTLEKICSLLNKITNKNFFVRRDCIQSQISFMPYIKIGNKDSNIQSKIVRSYKAFVEKHITMGDFHGQASRDRTKRYKNSFFISVQEGRIPVYTYINLQGTSSSALEELRDRIL